MLQVQVKRPALDVEHLYEGKGVRFDAAQAIAAIGHAYERTITTKIVRRTGPLYYGELEQLILDPLVERSISFLKSVTDEERSQAMRRLLVDFSARGLAYATIDQVLKVFEIREVSKNLTNEMLQTSDIYKTLTALGATPENSGGKNEDAKVAPILTMIINQINGRNIAQKDNDAITKDLYDMGDATIAAKIIAANFFGTGYNIKLSEWTTAYSNSIPEVYKQLIAIAKSGKGMALTKDGRADVSQKLLVVRNAVTQMFSVALASTNDDPIGLGATAMTLGSAFLNYLKMAENPDSYFPRQDLQFNVVAWAGGLKQEASELKNFWTYHAIAPGSFTIQLADSLWQSEVSWMSFMGPEFDVLKQAKEGLAAARDRFSVIESEFYSDLARKVLEDMKIRTGATHILPINLLKAESFSNAIREAVAKVEREDAIWTYTGGSVSADPTQMFDIPCSQKTRLSEQMAERAQVIVDAYDIAVRSAQMVSLSLDDPQPIRPFIPMEVGDLMWEEVKPITLDERMTFTMPEATSTAIPQWSGAAWPDNDEALQAFMPQWWQQQYLYKTFRPIRALFKALDASEDLIMWNKDEVPEVIGDAITRPWGMQPVPACYTYSRNRSIAPYTMREYLLSMEHAIDGIPRQDYLKHAAELIAIYGAEDPISLAIIDYLAPVMSVATSKSNGVILPRLKTIYGVPTAKFFAKQKGPELAQARKAKGLAEVQRTYELDAEDGTITVAFRLHQQFPAPAPIDYYVQTLSTGLTIVVPVLRSTADRFFVDGLAKDYFQSREKDGFLDITGEQLLDAILAEYQDSQASWVKPGGFAPFKLWMPATYYSVFHKRKEATNEDTIMYATAAAVKWRVSEVTGALQVRGFVNDPICLLDNKDRLEALDQIDPVPEETHLLPPSDISKGTQEPGHTEGPEPSEIRSQEPQKRAEVATETLKTPVISTSPAKSPDDETNAGSDVTVKFNVPTGSAGLSEEEKPLAGSAEPSQEEFLWVVEEIDGKKKLRKVKKDEVPENSRLASEEEIAEWLKENPEHES